MKLRNLTGQRFGKLTALECVGSNGTGQARWLCVCDCGEFVIVRGTNLLTGNSKSCGCERSRKSKHGMIKTALYRVWANIKTCCYNEYNKRYKYYGARGIVMCDEWRNDFVAFYDWAIENGYKEEKLPNGRNKWTLKRIDVNGNYEPNNCQWVKRSRK